MVLSNDEGPQTGRRRVTRRRRAVVAFTTAAVLAGGLLVSPTAQASPATAPTTSPSDATGVRPGTKTPKLVWGSCGAALEQFRCATAEVPTDYDTPRGAMTTIALIKLPASGPGRRLGTLFTNPGGPGGSGVEFVTAAETLYTPAVRARYDVLGFDPRGVARSDPATCFRTAEQEGAAPLLQTAYPLTRPEGRTYIADAVSFGRQCTSTSPSRFRHASTANVARDLELLRRAVGDAKLNYAGYSYGTLLGATYAKLFPGRVGRFVLDGTVDPLAWSGTGSGDAAGRVPFGIRSRQGVGATETFTEFGRLCRAAGPAGCSLAALGDPVAVAERTFDRLAVSPVTVETPAGPLVINQQAAVSITFSALYDPAGWADLSDLLAALSAPSPDEGRVLGALARTNTVYGEQARGEQPPGARRGDDYASVGGNLASLCVDTLASGRLGAYPAIADAYDRFAPYFGRSRLWTGAVCERWSVRDSDAFTGPWQQTTHAKVLVIGTRFDPATPYRQTRPYAALFPRADVLTVNGYGHTALLKSSCADRAVTRYLLTGATAGRSATCRQDRPPFNGGVALRSGAEGVLPRLLGL